MLGRVNVDQMLAEIPQHLFLEWQEYFMLEPFGPLQDDLRSGNEIAYNAAFHGCQKAGKKPYQATDIYPHLEGKTHQEKADDDLVAELDNIFGIGK